MITRVLLFSIVLIFCACSSETQKMEVTEAPAPDVTSETSWPVYGNLVEITTNQMDFQMPGEIPPGLTTFRYYNNSGMTHFILFDKMPVVDGEQKTLHHTETEVANVFNDGMTLLNEGKNEEAIARFGDLPPWFGQVVYSGGVGLIAGGEVAQVTLDMDSGVYVFECYVKSNGVFHNVEGMAAELHVTGDDMEYSFPDAPITIQVNEDGFAMEGVPLAGLNTFKVNYNSQRVHENFVMHDVNIVRLDGSASEDDIKKWMNWMDPSAFGTPAPATFVGGIQEMPEGNSGIFTVRLEPGRYALISEIPNAGEKGFYKTFSISEETALAE
jgi:hypothetical protein